MRGHGDTRGAGDRAGHHEEEGAVPADGGHPHLVPVQDAGVRQCQHHGEDNSRNILRIIFLSDYNIFFEGFHPVLG